jgi:hypothetical protein
LSKGGHPPVKNLYEDLQDGHKLLALLEVLTNQKYVSDILLNLIIMSLDIRRENIFNQGMEIFSFSKNFK